MLALGMWTVHVAFDARMDAGKVSLVQGRVALLQGPDPGNVEFIAIGNAEYVESAVEYVVLGRMIDPDAAVGAAPVDCVDTFSLDTTVSSILMGP